MYLSGRNPTMRPEASRTVCGNWTQVRSLGFAAQRPDVNFHGGQLIDMLGPRDNPRVLNQEPDPMFQGPLFETVELREPARELSQPRCIACQTALLLLLHYCSMEDAQCHECQRVKA